jgi:ABC-type transport system involved in multi-copper enzyme maturation permease subunit
MIRFAWLQSRTQTVLAYALLAAVAIAAIVTGIQLAHVYNSTVTHCQSGCDLAIQQYLSRDNFMQQTLDILSRAVPALLGLFWGAPMLAREYETGTFRLAWTQTISKRRWLLTRLGLGALATVVLAGLFSVTVTWWYHSRDKVGANAYDVFDRRDLAPVAYALFAFAAGVMFGALIRRTVPAMVATLGLFVFARIAVSIWVRPHLLAVQHAVVTLARQGPVRLGIELTHGGTPHILANGGGPSGSWTLSSHFVSASGQRVSSGQMAAFLHHYCPSLLLTAPPVSGPTKVPADDPGALCLAEVSKSFRVSVAYQPASRYWTFQWLEAAIFIALTLLVGAGTYWWVTQKSE